MVLAQVAISTKKEMKLSHTHTKNQVPGGFRDKSKRKNNIAVNVGGQFH